MAANLLVRRLVKMGLKKITPGVSKEARNRGVKATLKDAVKEYETKAGKAYLEKKPVRDRAMLQMADKIRKDIETLFRKK
jgi:hypothetical protein